MADTAQTPDTPEPAASASHVSDRREVVAVRRAPKISIFLLTGGAVGLLVAAPSTQARLTLAERTRQSHVVTRVRVQTVTADVIHGEPRYQLVVAEVGPPLGSAGLPGGRAELEVVPQTPAFGIVRAHDARLVGKSFVGFFRWFRAGEEPRLHWHLAADDPETLSAVREAALVAEN